MIDEYKKIQEIFSKRTNNDIRVLPEELQRFVYDLSEKIFQNDTRLTTYAIMNNIFEWPCCLVCGKKLKANAQHKFPKYCSQKCMYQVSDEKENRNKKRENTCLKKYGVKHNWSSGPLREHQKQTCIERYGVDSFSKTQEFKNKCKQTWLKNLGTDSPFKNSEIRRKINEKFIKKYGVPYVPFREEYIDKRKQTLIDKYGVNCSLQIAEIKNIQLIQSRKQSYQYILNINQNCIPLFNEEEFIQYGGKHFYNWKCKTCGKIHSAMPRVGSNGYKNIKCPYCSPKSLSQVEFQQFIESFNIKDIIFNDRQIIHPKELDIYIPSKKLAFEFNGVFWHSDNCKPKNYHLDKLNACKNNGIKLIHIWDYDWNNKKEIIKGRINNILNNNLQKLYARKCIVKEINSTESNNFLNTYHLQGGDKSKIKLGLYYNDQLVAVMTFSKPRFNKKYEYELVRYCTKFGYRILGGAGKLLKYFELNYTPKSIITYADKCWSDGNLYKQIGFKFVGDTVPNYNYYKNNNKLTRYECQKHKLPNLLKENFNPNLSEYDNMINNDFVRVYDCGNLIFERIFKNN